MSIASLHASIDPTPRSGRRGRFWSAAWDRVVALAETQSRVQTFRRLNAKSDAELQTMGLTRDRIVYHVFSDRMWM